MCQNELARTLAAKHRNINLQYKLIYKRIFLKWSNQISRQFSFKL